MGANDAREQLEVCKTECVRLERREVELLAIIERTRVAIGNGVPWNVIADALASVDTSALAERDAETRRKAAEEWADRIESVPATVGRAILQNGIARDIRRWAAQSIRALAEGGENRGN